MNLSYSRNFIMKKRSFFIQIFIFAHMNMMSWSGK